MSLTRLSIVDKIINHREDYNHQQVYQQLHQSIIHKTINMYPKKQEKITRGVYEETGGAPCLRNKAEAAARAGREAAEQKSLHRDECSQEGGANRSRSRGDRKARDGEWEEMDSVSTTRRIGQLTDRKEEAREGEERRKKAHHSNRVWKVYIA